MGVERASGGGIETGDSISGIGVGSDGVGDGGVGGGGGRGDGSEEGSGGTVSTAAFRRFSKHIQCPSLCFSLLSLSNVSNKHNVSTTQQRDPWRMARHCREVGLEPGLMYIVLDCKEIHRDSKSTLRMCHIRFPFKCDSRYTGEWSDGMFLIA